MPHAYAQTVQAACPHCERPIEFDIWLIVDAAERPDLVDRARDGTLHAVDCPHCGHAGGVDAPLLLYLPDRDSPLLFSPAQNTTAEQDREQAAGLLNRLREGLGDVWQDDWLADGLTGVPRPLLPAVLEGGAEGVEAAMEAALAQAQQEVERLREEDPEAYAQLEAAARQALDAPAAEKENKDRDGVKSAAAALPLTDRIIAWIETPDWAMSEAYLRQHQADLLTDRAETLVGELVDAAREQRGQEAARTFQSHHALLRRAREAGVEDAYREFHAARAGLDAAPALSLDNEALSALLQVDSAASLEQALAEHPALLALPTLEELAELLERMQADGQPDAARHLLARLAILLEQYNHTHAENVDLAEQARFAALHEAVLPAAATLDEDLAAGLRRSLGWALNTLGNAHAEAGDHAAAVEAYTRAIGHDPENGMLYRNRAGEYIEMEQWTLAHADVERAAALEPDAPRLAQLREALALPKSVTTKDAKSTRGMKE